MFLLFVCANFVYKQIRLFIRTKYTVSSSDLTEYKDFNNLPFSSYLAGLIEGDGTIVVPKTERSLKGVLNYACIQIKGLKAS